MRVASFFKILIIVFFYFSNPSLLGSLLFYNKHDPTIDIKISGTIYPFSWSSTSCADYFIVQNYQKKQECSVYNSAGQFLRSFPGEFCYFIPEKRFLSYIGDTIFLYNDQCTPLWSKKLAISHELTVYEPRKEILAVEKKIYLLKGTVHRSDIVHIFDYSGNELFFLDLRNNLDELEPLVEKKKFEKILSEDNRNIIKINSVRVIGETLLSKSNAAFKEGNLLINIRSLDLIIILDRLSKKIVWSYKTNAHTPFLASNNHIIYFKNFNSITNSSSPFLMPGKYTYDASVGRFYTIYYDDETERYFRGEAFFSSLVELDPITKKIVWEYRPHRFESFASAYFGSVLECHDKSLLVSHISNGGSLFQINREQKILWEWVNSKNRVARPDEIYRVTIPNNKKALEYFLSIWP